MPRLHKIHLIILCLSFISILAPMKIYSKEKLCSYVDPFIGTGGHGHTYPGATLPFGMIQLSPDTRVNNWDACSGYHYSDRTILGFSHTHLSGTGVGDYGDIRLMPTIGELLLDPGDEKVTKTGYRSHFKHSTEIAYPGFYSVFLEDYNIEVQLTSTMRAGFHKYTFPQSNESNIILDLKNGISNETIIESSLEIINNRTIRGLRRSKGWGKNQYVYFYAEFSRPFKDYLIKKDNKDIGKKNFSSGLDIRAGFSFKTEKNEVILVKVGISAVDIKGAEENLKHEIPAWDFNRVKRKGEKIWEEALNKIQIEDKDINNKKIFYTSLYHSFLAPNLFMDIDGRYRGIDHKIYKMGKKKFKNYTVFSLWDTFRALHPLFTIIEQKRTVDFINSLLFRYKEGGKLPIWELAGNYTGCMIGYHAVSVIVDAYFKGIREGYDNKLAYRSIKQSAMSDQLGLKFYKNHGYISSAVEGEAVSKTLEYAYDDWCISRMAKSLNLKRDFELFNMRAQYYKNIFSKEVGFMRPRKNGFWKTPFDPKEVDFNFTEANSWQYSFFVPQDISGLIEIMGGENAFDSQLDKLFNEDTKTIGRTQADITGLIGQYAHGNEPSHHMAYLYNFIGKPWKTQGRVREIIDKMYSSRQDGLCGNEDCGQMSAWYIFSSMGFYPVTPGKKYYVIGTPKFKKITINLENGKTFIINAKDISERNFYIKGVRLNGKKYSRSYLKHEDIMKGGVIDFEMSNVPNKIWGYKKKDRPESKLKNAILTVPYFTSGSKTFSDSTKITIKNDQKLVNIHYTINGDEPDIRSAVYSKPLRIDKNTIIKARAIAKDGRQSYFIKGEFFKVKNNYSIKSFTDTTTQYTAGGAEALIDGIRGKENFRLGGWRGYQKKHLDVIIDIKKIKMIKSVTVGFLQDQNSWIFFPNRVEILSSLDGKQFKKVSEIKNFISPKKEDVETQNFYADLKSIKARYIKVIGYSILDCPKWHKGYGSGAFIFTDEIAIETK